LLATVAGAIEAAISRLANLIVHPPTPSIDILTRDLASILRCRQSALRLERMIEALGRFDGY
jgi:hypothetical protein